MVPWSFVHTRVVVLRFIMCPSSWCLIWKFFWCCRIWFSGKHGGWVAGEVDRRRPGFPCRAFISYSPKIGPRYMCLSWNIEFYTKSFVCSGMHTYVYQYWLPNSIHYISHLLVLLFSFSFFPWIFLFSSMANTRLHSFFLFLSCFFPLFVGKFFSKYFQGLRFMKS